MSTTGRIFRRRAAREARQAAVEISAFERIAEDGPLCIVRITAAAEGALDEAPVALWIGARGSMWRFEPFVDDGSAVRFLVPTRLVGSCPCELEVGDERVRMPNPVPALSEPAATIVDAYRTHHSQLDGLRRRAGELRRDLRNARDSLTAAEAAGDRAWELYSNSLAVSATARDRDAEASRSREHALERNLAMTRSAIAEHVSSETGLIEAEIARFEADRRTLKVILDLLQARATIRAERAARAELAEQLAVAGDADHAETPVHALAEARAERDRERTRRHDLERRLAVARVALLGSEDRNNRLTQALDDLREALERTHAQQARSDGDRHDLAPAGSR